MLASRSSKRKIHFCRHIDKPKHFSVLIETEPKLQIPVLTRFLHANRYSFRSRTFQKGAFSNTEGTMIFLEWPRYLVLIVLLLLAAFGYCRGRGRSPAWTNIPLIALAILSIGPSVCAVILYLSYEFGLIQPSAPGYQFRSFVYSLPVDFALLNWAFVPLYVVGRIWPRGSGRLAMWFAVVAMSVPNVVLFGLASEMVSNARDAGQGIGIIEAVLLWSPIQTIVPGMFAIVDAAGFEYSFVLNALTGFLPILGLVAWLLGHLVGRQVRTT